MGVLFVTKDNFTLTLGPAPPSEDLILIPSFTVSNVAYEEAGGDSMAVHGSAVFPAVEKYEAPENIVSPKQPISVNNAATNQEIEQSSKSMENENTDVFLERVAIWIPILCILLLCIFFIGKRVKIIRKRNQLFAIGHMTHEMQTQTFQEEENIRFSTMFPSEKPLNTKLARERKHRAIAAGVSNRSSKNVCTGSEVAIELNDNVGFSTSASMRSYLEEGGTGRHQLSVQIPRPEIGQSQTDRKATFAKRGSLKV